MVIAIDGNEANVQNLVGVSVYTHELLKRFQKQANEETRYIVFLKSKALSHMPEECDYFRYQIVWGPAFWSQIFLPLWLFFRSGINVFFSPAHYIPRFLRIPTVVTIHDLSYFYFPQEFLKKDLFKLTHWTYFAVSKAEKIIAVSKTTKKDIVKWYQRTENNIVVIYNGFQSREDTPESGKALDMWGLRPMKYLLYVGTVQPRKNIGVLIRGFELWKKNHPEYKLVIAGKKGWLSEPIFSQIENSQNAPDIVVTGYVDDLSLVALYKHAFSVVMPSLYEGFGLPILEAMSHAVPVISSHSSSLPEIGASACEYFDPHNPEDLVHSLEELAANPAFRKELIKKGSVRIKEFSWDTCARETLEVLQSVSKHV